METIVSSRGSGAIGPYSPGIRTGPFVFTSGQIPIDPETGALIEGPIGAQTTRALENVEAILVAAGTGRGKVVKTTIFLVDMADFAAVNAAYAAFFGEHKPARSTVQVARLPKDARIEIEAVAER